MLLRRPHFPSAHHIINITSPIVAITHRRTLLTLVTSRRQSSSILSSSSSSRHITRHNHNHAATSVMSSHPSATSPFVAQGVAFPTPFHSHAFVSAHGGANAYSSTAATAPATSSPVESPSRRNGYGTASTLPVDGVKVGSRNGSSTNLAALGSTPPQSQQVRHMSSNSSPHSSRDVSPFLKSKAKNSVTSTASTTNGDAASPATKANGHQHHDGCCSGDATIESDDQLISDDHTESGSEEFLANVDRGIHAVNALTQSLALSESLNDATPKHTPNDSHHSPSPDSPSTKWNLHSLLEHNHRFVADKAYEPFLTDRFPYKKLVVVTCMDTRLTQLLPLALDLKNGDAKIIKVAGAMVAHPFGSVMRSILVAVYGLGAEHILVVGHHDCGMTGMNPSLLLAQAKQRGIPDATFKTLKAAGLDLDSWLSGFDNVRTSVLHSVDTIKNHPLLNFEETSVKVGDTIAPPTSESIARATSGRVSPPTVAKTRIPKITVTGLVICPTTGKLDLVTPAGPEIEALIRSHEEAEAEIASSEKELHAGHRAPGQAP